MTERSRTKKCGACGRVGYPLNRAIVVSRTGVRASLACGACRARGVPIVYRLEYAGDRARIREVQALVSAFALVQDDVTPRQTAVASTHCRYPECDCAGYVPIDGSTMPECAQCAHMEASHARSKA
jgi:hypothetical protein